MMKTKPEKVPRLSSLIDMFCLCRCVGKKSGDVPLPLNTTTAAQCPIIKAPDHAVCRVKMAEGGGQLYACDICGQDGLTDDDMRSHVLIEHVEGAISCPFCDLEGTTVEEMNMHVNGEHLDFLTPTKEMMAGLIAAERGVRGADIQNSNNGFAEDEDPCVDTPCDGSDSTGSEGLIPGVQVGGGGNKSSGDSASVSGLSSVDTTPEGYSDLVLTPPPVPMEITITAADSPKRVPPPAATAAATVPSTDAVRDTARTQLPVPPPETKTKKAGSPPDGEEQLRKRAKLYLDVPPVRPKQQQQLCKNTNDNCSTAGEGNANNGEEKRDAEKPYVNGTGTENAKSPTSGSGTLLSASTPPRTQVVHHQCDRESPLRCPLCDWTTKSPGEIMRHVNAQHLDILSPLSAKARSNNQHAPTAQQQQQQHQQQQQQQNQQNHKQQRTDTENNVIVPSTSTSTISQLFECPICGHAARSGSDLELHVNGRHADILSPGGVAHSASSSSSGVATQTMLQSPMSIGSSTDSSMCCPVCGMEFADTHDLAVHVDGHFSAEHTPVTEQMDNLLAQELERRERVAYKMQEQREFEKLQELYGMNGKSNYRKQAERNLERAVCHGQMSISDYYTRKQEIQTASVAGIDDGHSCTGAVVRGSDILARLRSYYNVVQSNVGAAWLASACDHFAASYGDKGWGCGYRNLQMLLSCLSTNPSYEQILFNVDVNEGAIMIPSIPKIQRLIEAAWQKGFDLQGCEQLGGKVVDTTKWIGATEIVATLSSLKVKCQLIDFHAPTGKDGTHPRLFEWVRDYFKKDTDFKSPLYLQHQGHSRTIVGIEQLKDGHLRLLLFDPSCSRKQMHQFVHGEISANLMRCLRRGIHSMKAKQYQIVAVVGVLSDQEYEESKVMKSDRIP